MKINSLQHLISTTPTKSHNYHDLSSTPLAPTSKECLLERKEAFVVFSGVVIVADSANRLKWHIITPPRLGSGVL